MGLGNMLDVVDVSLHLSIHCELLVDASLCLSGEYGLLTELAPLSGPVSRVDVRHITDTTDQFVQLDYIVPVHN